jgi:hypothetical protein
MRLVYDLRMGISVQDPVEIPGLHVRNEFSVRQDETNRSVGGTGEVQGNPLRQTPAAISYLLIVARQSMATLNADVLNAFVGTPTAVTVTGLKSFLRAAGADNNPFGRWWFAAETLLGLNEPLERIPLPAAHRREALLGRIRAATAISVDWNTLSEFWIMLLPEGKS